MIHLLRVLEAATEVQAFCAKNGWKFCFIGGVAVQRWGEPRLTQDVDLTLLAGFGDEEKYIDLELKGELGALDKLEQKLALVERRLRTKL